MTKPSKISCLYRSYLVVSILAMTLLSACGRLASMTGASAVAPTAPPSATATALPSLTPTVRRSPSATPSPAPPTDTPRPSVTATAAKAANLRSGPSTDYLVVGGAIAGQKLNLVGQNRAGDWYQLDDGSWIAGFLLVDAPHGLPITEPPD